MAAEAEHPVPSERARELVRGGVDYHVHIALAAGMLKRFREIASHVPGERVQLLRPVERYRGDAGSFSDVDVFVGHGEF